MAIERHNLFELTGRGHYHSALLTCYTFDPIFFSSWFMPKLRQCGIVNVAVLVDAGCYDRMMECCPSFGLRPDLLRYTVVRQRPTSSGVFHPKVAMLAGEDEGMLLVGSGNLTYNGYGLNDEVWSVFSLKGDDSPYLPLFAEAWACFDRYTAPRQTLLEQQFRWIETNAPWLARAVAGGAARVGAERFSFHTERLLGKIEQAVAGRRVEAIEIVSPFYDTDGMAVRNIERIFRPLRMSCVVTAEGIPPLSLMNNPGKIQFYEWRDVCPSQTRTLHAKIIQLRLADSTILAVGSANATIAALYGANDEACVVIESDTPRDYLDELGIRLSATIPLGAGRMQDYTADERPDKACDGRRFQLFSAELAGCELRLATDASGLGLGLALLGIDGKTLAILEADADDGVAKVVLPHGIVPPSIVVLIDCTEHRTEISNRCLVSQDEVVSRFNPAKAMRSLEALLDTSTDWKANLVKILSFIIIEDAKPSSKTIGRGHDSRERGEEEPCVLTRDQFERLRHASGHTGMSLPEVRLLDFLLEEETSGRKSRAICGLADDTEGLSQEEIDAGQTSYQSLTRREKSGVEPLFKTLKRYDRRLASHYAARLAGFHASLARHGVLTEFPYANPVPATLKDCSHMLIEAVLVWRQIAEEPETAYHIQHDTGFLCNLGAYLLLSRREPEETDSLSGRKSVEFGRSLSIYSLMILSRMSFRAGRAMIQARLLVLNILDSWYGDREMDTARLREMFLARLEEERATPCQSSLDMILDAMTEYSLFSISKAPVAAYGGGTYIWKKRWGFCYIHSFCLTRDKSGSLKYRYSVIHPGVSGEPSAISESIVPLCCGPGG